MPSQFGSKVLGFSECDLGSVYHSKHFAHSLPTRVLELSFWSSLSQLLLQ